MDKLVRNPNVPTVIVTAGGTREDIDEVRFLTNISTGKLGARIAERVMGAGWNLIYIHTETSALPMSVYPLYYEIDPCEDPSQGFPAYAAVKVRSTKNAYDAMKKWVPFADAVIHSMACGDFGFSPEKTKLKSNDPMVFVDSLRSRIVVNPKILNEIKKWNPKTVLVSFKFESGQTHENLIEIATVSMHKANGDFVVANDKSEMTKAGVHIAYIVPAIGDMPIQRVEGKSSIADSIFREVEWKLRKTAAVA